jgi:hypothetical protein
VTALLRNELVCDEDPGTADLMQRLRHVKRRRAFSRAEFLAMCRWKSPRPLHHYRRNSAASVERAARVALATRSERRRLEALTRLRGVSVPVASAILTLVDPRRYGVIDIRAWQVLYALGSVGAKPAGAGFRFADWHHYLTTLRHHARRLGVPARTIEHTLFRCHRKFQLGTLYRRPR